MKKKALLFCAGERTSLPKLPPREETLVIAADGGYEYCLETVGAPDLAVGDFDSLGYIPKGGEVLVYPREKDDTDLGIAIKEALARGCCEIYIFGATGGRLDHTVASLQSLLSLAGQGVRAFLFGQGFTATATTSGLSFPASYTGTVSVFAAGGECLGVTLSGLRYTAEGATLSPLMPLGVSNEFAGQAAKIVCQAGILLILWQDNLDKPLPSCYTENS